MSKKQTFYLRAKIRLLERGQTISDLARMLGFDRASISLVIHGRRRMPGVEAEVRRELGL